MVLRGQTGLVGQDGNILVTARRPTVQTLVRIRLRRATPFLGLRFEYIVHAVGSGRRLVTVGSLIHF